MISGRPASPALRWWRQRRFAVVLAAVLAVLLGGLVYLGLGVDVGGGSPSGTAVSYLQALARGDAAAALSAGPAPKDRALLTDAVLAEQRKLAPISQIRVRDTHSGAYGAVVEVSYLVGSKQVQDSLNVVRVDGNWRMAGVAVDVEVSGGGALPPLRIFGRTVSAAQDLFVFPGAVAFGSDDPDLAIAPSSVVFTSPDVPALVVLGVRLTPEGEQNGARAITDSLDTCARSTSLAPPGCPQSAARPAGAVEGSWRWSVTGVETTAFTADARTPARYAVTATLTWALSYQTPTAGGPAAQSLTVRTPISGTLDYSATRVTFTR